MSSSIAAVVLIGVLLLAPLLDPPRADAAALLQEVTEANQAYKGWLHLRSDDGDASHINTADGTHVLFNQRDGAVKWAKMIRPPTREEFAYDGERNEIRIADLPTGMGAMWTAMSSGYPLTASAMLESFEKRGIGKPAVTERTEDGLQRFDLVLPPPSATRPAGERAQIPSHVTLWADPRTKLIAKMQAKMIDRTVTLHCTYGPPGVNDLYDVGVPRDARIIDNRIKGDEIGYLTRLQERVDHGFGDGVAVLTELEIGADGKPDASRGVVHLFAYRGVSLFAGRYVVGPPTDANAGFRVALPVNWPNPSADDALRALRDVMPTNFLVADRGQAWEGFGASANEMQVRPVDLRTPEPMQQSRAMADLGGMIWPTRYSLGVFGTESGFKLLGDTKRPPNVIGVGVDQMVQLDPATKRRTVREHWLDRAHDDVPVEVTTVTYGADGASIALKYEAKYDPPQQLPNGLWYPSRWRHKWSGNTITRDTEAELTLRIFPGHPVDAAWFTNPVERVKK